MFNLISRWFDGRTEQSGGGGTTDWVMWAILGGLVGLFVVMIFLQRRRQRATMENQGAMLERIRMGMRIKTVSGVVGRIKEIREEFGGARYVLIETGNDKHSSFLQLDINAIMEVMGEESAPAEIPAPVIEEPVAPAAEEFNAAEFVEKSNATRKRKPKTQS